MLWDDEAEERFLLARHCHVCKKNRLAEPIVRDHCPFIGNLCGSAHPQCNLNYKRKYKLPVLFHILHGYHAHLIFQKIKRIIYCNSEKF